MIHPWRSAALLCCRRLRCRLGLLLLERPACCYWAELSAGGAAAAAAAAVGGKELHNQNDRHQQQRSKHAPLRGYQHLPGFIFWRQRPAAADATSTEMLPSLTSCV